MGNCGSSPNYEDIFIDIEYHSDDSNIGEEEGKLSQNISNVLDSDLLNRFESYQDAQNLTNEAIAHPTEASKNAAWDAVLPNVELQSQLFDFAETITNFFSETIKFLVSNITIDNRQFQHNGKTGPEVFEDFPVAMNCLCEIAKISIRYDNIKLRLPKLLGDMAYFRRAVSRNIQEFEDLFMKTSRMTIFFADASPMVSRCLNELSNEYSQSEKKANLLTLLQNAIDGLTATVSFHPFENAETNIKVLYGIAFLILLYDNFSTNGAFHAKTPIQIAQSLQAIRDFEPKQAELINTIKYSSKHFSDQTTPANIADILK